MRRVTELIFAPLLWSAIGCVFLALGLLANTSPRATLWFAEIFLLGVFGIGLLSAPRTLTLPPSRAAIAFVAIVWCAGMLYELSLTVDGTGIGGVHQETAVSFLLAQGDYLPLAGAALLLTWALRLRFFGLFWIAAGMSLTEALIFAPVLVDLVTVQQYGMAVLCLGYYFLIYAAYVAMPLLWLDPAPLWRAGVARDWQPLVLLAAGFTAALMVRLFWGLIYAPIIERLLKLTA